MIIFLNLPMSENCEEELVLSPFKPLLFSRSVAQLEGAAERECLVQKLSFLSAADASYCTGSVICSAGIGSTTFAIALRSRSGTKPSHTVRMLNRYRFNSAGSGCSWRSAACTRCRDKSASTSCLRVVRSLVATAADSVRA